MYKVDRTPEGKKELIGFQTGMRESAQSWKELLVDLKARGLSIAPEVAVGDRALGFWKALDEMFPATRQQRCWLHKTLNVLDKFPKSMQPNAHKDLREIWLAPDRATAETAIATFAEKYAPKYDKAVECLIRDRETLLTFFDFTADHWDHLRTTNPIESVFATKPSLTKGVPSWAINLAFPTLEELIDACPKNIGSATFVLGPLIRAKSGSPATSIL